MNTRTIVLIGAVALLGIGLIMTLLEFLQPPPSEPRVQTAVAAQAIEPYTVITQDMVASGDEIRARDAQAQAAWRVEDVVGKMSMDLIAPGDLLTAVNAQPVEDVRFVEDLGLEIVSFQAAVDRLVGGQLRPGHIINLYGFGRDEETNESFTMLIEPRVWVVGVSASGRPVSEVTPQIDPDTGLIERGGSVRPSTMLTVAVPPEKALHIIDTLGAQGLNAWVTLAANQTADAAALATAPPPTLVPPTAGVSVDLAGTATALWLAIQQTPPPPPPRTGDGGTSR
jgi:hypothetical protein